VRGANRIVRASVLVVSGGGREARGMEREARGVERSSRGVEREARGASPNPGTGLYQDGMIGRTLGGPAFPWEPLSGLTGRAPLDANGWPTPASRGATAGYGLRG
jgi:hypothetical protein